MPDSRSRTARHISILRLIRIPFVFYSSPVTVSSTARSSGRATHRATAAPAVSTKAAMPLSFASRHTSAEMWVRIAIPTVLSTGASTAGDRPAGLAQLVHQGAHALHRPQGHGQNQRSGGQRENQPHLLRPLLHHHGAHSGGYGGGGNLQNILHGSQPEQVFNQFKQAADLLHHHH